MVQRTTNNEKIDRPNLSLAAEYAVASELCRRGIYAQLTLGNLKRTDLLAFRENGDVVKIEVKAKQGAGWPHCKGIHGKNRFLVFVDYEGKTHDERPDFYIMSGRSWRAYVKRRIKYLEEIGSHREVRMNSENVPIWTKQSKKSGKPYTGIIVRASRIQRNRERWSLIEKAVKS